MNIPSGLFFREEVLPSDAEAVERIVASTGFFTPHEIEIARELVEERLSLGEDSGYFFVFLEEDAKRPESSRPEPSSPKPSDGQPTETPVQDASPFSLGSDDSSAPPVSGGRRVVGFACFGPIPCTDTSFDLYWIAVSGESRGHGLGPVILRRAEEAARALGATRLYAETSSTDLYTPTRRFYERTGFAEEARLADFYRPGDGKVIYGKRLA